MTPEQTMLKCLEPKNRGGRPPGYCTSAETRAKLRDAMLKHAQNDVVARERRNLCAALIEGGATNKAAGIVLGITKSAVSGILELMQRQGIVVNRPPKPIKAKAPKKPWQPRSKTPTPPQPRYHIEHPPMTPVGLLVRTGCAYPTNDGGPFLFCNNAVRELTPYCEFHGNLMVNHG